MIFHVAKFEVNRSTPSLLGKTFTVFVGKKKSQKYVFAPFSALVTLTFLEGNIITLFSDVSSYSRTFSHVLSLFWWQCWFQIQCKLFLSTANQSSNWPWPCMNTVRKRIHGKRFWSVNWYQPTISMYGNLQTCMCWNLGTLLFMGVPYIIELYDLDLSSRDLFL